MSATLLARLAKLDVHATTALKYIGRGIEKEGLRVDPHHFIAQTDHPSALGHPLTHASITTDYSEALLELITPVTHSPEALVSALQDIHVWVQRNLDDEVLWAGSMPCRLEGDASIRIAEYGTSNTGRLKHVYREGLSVRYGRIMQSIAGLHFNFSMPDAFWNSWQAQLENRETLQTFKSNQYFALIRNFRRHSWMLMYLFGASPALDASFLEGKTHQLSPLHGGDTWYLPYATSLRMGDLGYHNNAQSSLNICFNRLDNFIRTLGQAIHKPWPAYEAIGTQRDGRYIQLNTNILQIENEYYSPIRPKRTTERGERPLQALQSRGVEYIEVRCLDLNPFLPLGVDVEQVRFLDVFLLYCLMSESALIGDAECSLLDDNFARVVARGREPGLHLHYEGQDVPMSALGLSMLDEMLPVAELMDSLNQTRDYRSALEAQRQKFLDPQLTPSAKVLEAMQANSLSWCEFAAGLSRQHQSSLQQASVDSGFTERFTAQAIQSIKEEQHLAASNSCDFSQFLKDFQV